MNTIEQIAAEQAQWSQSVFGSDATRGPVGALKHLRDEAQEAMDNPGDIMEFADCLLLVMDASRRAGHQWPALVAAAGAKLEICKSRQWATVVDDEPVKHVDESRPERVVDRVDSLISVQLCKDRAQIAPHLRLVEDLGADSLDAVELVMQLEDEFGVRISDEEANAFTDVQSVVNCV